MVLSPDFILAVQQESLHVLFVVGVGATLALFLTFSEYLLLSNTSSITVSICGIMKVWILSVDCRGVFRSLNIFTQQTLQFHTCNHTRCLLMFNVYIPFFHIKLFYHHHIISGDSDIRTSINSGRRQTVSC